MKTCKSSVSLSGDMTPTSELLPALKRGQWLRAGDKGAPPSGVRGSFSEARSHSLSQETSFCSEPRPFLGVTLLHGSVNFKTREAGAVRCVLVNTLDFRVVLILITW